MDYNFDHIIDRRNTDSLKVDRAAGRGMPEDVLPLWVADMDFPAPDCVLDALAERTRHGIFGYSEPGADYDEALTHWFTGRFGYTFDPKWVVRTPGVVYAICTAIRAFTGPGDGVLIQEPVYYPFRGSVEVNGRTPVVSELVYDGEGYSIDFADFETKIKDNGVKLFILCSPHNPVGRVWRPDELHRMVDICIKYNVLIVSDEIHCDFVHPGHTHSVLPALVPEHRDRIVLCTAPSKTFNLAGLQISNTFISDPELRRAFCREMDRSGYSQVGGMGLVACRAAYAGGADWLEALKAYLWENFLYVDRVLRAELPQVRLVRPQGTYLAWLDCRELGLEAKALDHKIVHEARLWLDGGTMFGSSGAGFQRVNVACPRATLETAMGRLVAALK